MGGNEKASDFTKANNYMSEMLIGKCELNINNQNVGFNVKSHLLDMEARKTINQMLEYITTLEHRIEALERSAETEKLPIQ